MNHHFYDKPPGMFRSYEEYAKNKYCSGYEFKGSVLTDRAKAVFTEPTPAENWSTAFYSFLVVAIIVGAFVIVFTTEMSKLAMAIVLLAAVAIGYVIMSKGPCGVSESKNEQRVSDVRYAINAELIELLNRNTTGSLSEQSRIRRMMRDAEELCEIFGGTFELFPKTKAALARYEMEHEGARVPIPKTNLSDENKKKLLMICDNCMSSVNWQISMKGREIDWRTIRHVMNDAERKCEKIGGVLALEASVEQSLESAERNRGFSNV